VSIKQVAIDSFEAMAARNQKFLAEIGTPTGCAAKWFQSTLHLQNGLTQSCYNTPQHKIDLEMLKVSPKALHNTLEKAVQRNLMKQGLRPPGCEYCWRIEDQKAETFSDRHRWNGYLGKDSDTKILKDLPANFMFNPKVLEVSFSNLCNFMCGYCHPKNSSRFYNEIKQYGAYKGDSHQCDIHFIKIYDEEQNPYLDAFWSWWPEMSLHLGTIRLTGGEPLVQKSTQRLFERLAVEPRPNLNLCINSNFGMSPQLFRTHCATVRNLVDKKCVRKIEFFTSLDTWGAPAEYVRYGLDLEIFKENVHHYMETFPEYDLSFMVTFNIFSLPNFIQLMHYWLELKKKHNHSQPNRLRTDLNILTEPIVFSYLLLPEDYALPKFDEILNFAKSHLDSTGMVGFTNLVTADLLKVKNDYILNKLPLDRREKARKDFVHFFKQYDLRKNLSLKQTFPDYVRFFEEW
jgi:hypothetical protein